MLDKIDDFIKDELAYVEFLSDERYCIINEDLIYKNKKIQEKQLDKEFKKQQTCDKYYKDFAAGYTREQIAKKRKVSIKLVEKYFDKWAF
jgi:hypothetical protein